MPYIPACKCSAAGYEVDTICLQSLDGLYDLIESNQCDAVGWSLMDTWTG